MAASGESSNGGMGDLEKDLSCSICTDILFQPLTLLDCLHSFCGACLKEWFSWQATSAAQTRRLAWPYTCPSCRESIRTTKADWRLTTLLEGYLKAHPDRDRSAEEKEEAGKQYKHGENVLPPIRYQVEEEDSEDERILARVREISLAEAQPGAATSRRRPDHSVRSDRRQGNTTREPGNERRSTRLTEARLQEHDAEGPQIGHQPSLRSLLSVSDADPQEVQAEILQSIYSEGLLDGVDTDNLTPEQEEELTERIAEAYRRRRRERRDRSRGQDPRRRERRSPRSQSHAEAADDSSTVGTVQSPMLTPPIQQSRSRPPISRPHLFEQSDPRSSQSHRRSGSSTSQRSNRSVTHDPSVNTAPASRSATDLSQLPVSSDPHGGTGRRPASAERSITEPDRLGTQNGARRPRTQSGNSRDGHPHSRRVTPLLDQVTSNGRQQPSAGDRAPTNAAPGVSVASSLAVQSVVRPAVSHSAFAPELVTGDHSAQAVPSVKCKRCDKADIEKELHYNCSLCDGGSFNICLNCYRLGRGCKHWFGFGYRAMERWSRIAPPSNPQERPHVLIARRYVDSSSHQNDHPSPQSQIQLEQGAFCERCFSFANASYWYCSVCLDGAWGFCETCVKTGHHCTHQLLPIRDLNSQTQPYPEEEPGKRNPLSLPHLPADSFIPFLLPTFCDLCRSLIPPHHDRFHCSHCNDGDYDVCIRCYTALPAQNRLSVADGANGWRRCPTPDRHRMATVAYLSSREGLRLRTVKREPVGGAAFKDDLRSRGGTNSEEPLPPDGGTGLRCLALYSYFPAEGVGDELAFPRNAEIREVQVVHEEWFMGWYAGEGRLFPSNHVRVL